MSRQRSPSAAGQVSLQVGQPFNPFKLFNGIYIPEALVRAKGISAGAKLAYGRLTRYAGRRQLPSRCTHARLRNRYERAPDAEVPRGVGTNRTDTTGSKNLGFGANEQCVCVPVASAF